MAFFVRARYAALLAVAILGVSLRSAVGEGAGFEYQHVFMYIPSGMERVQEIRMKVDVNNEDMKSSTRKHLEQFENFRTVYKHSDAEDPKGWWSYSASVLPGDVVSWQFVDGEVPAAVEAEVPAAVEAPGAAAVATPKRPDDGVAEAEVPAAVEAPGAAEDVPAATVRRLDDGVAEESPAPAVPAVQGAMREGSLKVESVLKGGGKAEEITIKDPSLRLFVYVDNVRHWGVWTALGEKLHEEKVAADDVVKTLPEAFKKVVDDVDMHGGTQIVFFVDHVSADEVEMSFQGEANDGAEPKKKKGTRKLEERDSGYWAWSVPAAEGTLTLKFGDEKEVELKIGTDRFVATGDGGAACALVFETHAQMDKTWKEVDSHHDKGQDHPYWSRGEHKWNMKAIEELYNNVVAEGQAAVLETASGPGDAAESVAAETDKNKEGSSPLTMIIVVVVICVLLAGAGYWFCCAGADDEDDYDGASPNIDEVELAIDAPSVHGDVWDVEAVSMLQEPFGGEVLGFTDDREIS